MATILDPWLAGSCTPPFKCFKNVASDAITRCFDHGFGEGSVPVFASFSAGLESIGAKEVDLNIIEGMFFNRWVREETPQDQVYAQVLASDGTM